MISLNKLVDLGKKGFIPGPKESEEEFIKRVEVLQTFAHDPNQYLHKGKYEPLKICSESIDATLSWVPQTYSNRRLLPWQGAVSWIFKTSDNNLFPMVQLRKGFKKGYFLFYELDEVIHHEAIHALRLVFNESRFEEILAYALSKQKWRRFIGPLFRSPKQTIFFILLTVLSLVLQTLSIFFIAASYLKWGPIIPLSYLVLRLTGLIRDQIILKKTYKTLRKLFPKKKNPFCIALRLKDKEIKQFSCDSLEDILVYIKKKSESSLRWQQILAQFS